MRNQGLFEPDVLIAQVWGDARRRSAALSSEKRLMLAVLHDALDCYQKYMFSYDRVGRELFREAAAWIECTNADGLFSFQNISETLDIEPEYFRRGLAEWHKRHLESQRPSDPTPSIAVSAVSVTSVGADLPTLRSAARLSASGGELKR